MSESMGDFWIRKNKEFHYGKLNKCPMCDRYKSLADSDQLRRARANQKIVDAAAQRVRLTLFAKYPPDHTFRKDVEMLTQIALAPVLEILT